jgi:hypothetical protein
LAKTLELIEKLSTGSYQSDYANAKAAGTCIICKRPAKEFRDGLARLEYSISALCQDCQDEYLNGK